MLFIILIVSIAGLYFMFRYLYYDGIKNRIQRQMRSKFFLKSGKLRKEAHQKFGETQSKNTVNLIFEMFKQGEKIFTTYEEKRNVNKFEFDKLKGIQRQLKEQFKIFENYQTLINNTNSDLQKTIDSKEEFNLKKTTALW